MSQTPTTPPPPTGSPMTRFLRGFWQPLMAMRLLLSTRGVKRWAVLPLIASVVVYTLIVVGAFWLLWDVELRVPEWDFWWRIGAWLSTVINWLLVTLKWVIALPVIAGACYFTFTTVGMVIAAPLNDILSEKVEKVICHGREGSKLPLKLTPILMVHGVWDAIKIAVRQLFWTLLVLPLLLVPVVGFVPLFVVGAYFAGLGFVDVPMARNFLRNRHKQPYFDHRRWEMLGLGVAMQLLFYIPFAGLLILPLGVTAGTQLYCDEDWPKLLASKSMEPPRGFVPPQRD
ncbi:MAG: hypothetical protein GC159_21365 [Phycisphaera sp.]|nr:hypothetical protein [Phycisphaera sp.]